VSLQGMQPIDQDRLPKSGNAHEFQGHEHGGVGVSFLILEAPPGAGPGLHKHPYEEIFIVRDGEATYFVGDQEHRVTAGQVVIVPADTPHGFVNSGTGPLRQVDIHVSPRFVTEWLDR
jgi:quercetin dioxygenase-like cupin family protein